MDITTAETGSHGEYSATVEGHKAEMTYSRTSPSLIIIDHTGVPDALRGKVFALWGLSQLMMGFVYVVALSRYRALIPLLLILMFLEYCGRYLIGHFRPLELTGTPPGKILDHVMIPLSLVLLYFSRPTSGRS